MLESKMLGLRGPDADASKYSLKDGEEGTAAYAAEGAEKPAASALEYVEMQSGVEELGKAALVVLRMAASRSWKLRLPTALEAALEMEEVRKLE